MPPRPAKRQRTASPPVNLNSLRSAASACRSDDSQIKVMFDDLPNQFQRAVDEMRPDALVGCVAWMTGSQTLEHLARSRIPCSIVLQKEAYLRPASGTPRGAKALKQASFTRRLREQYDSVRSLDADGAAFRCMGLAGSKASGGGTPFMHHKFFVFLKRVVDVESVALSDLARAWKHPTDGGTYVATAVWTGSFNFSKAGEASLENAVLLRSPHAAHSYLVEWKSVHALSEPLDWTSRSVKPRCS